MFRTKRNFNNKGILFLAVTFLMGGFFTNAIPADRSSQISRTSEEKAERKDLLLVTGLQTVVDLDFKPCDPIENCVKVTNASLLTVQYFPEKKQLIFTPLKNGETTVSVRDDGGELKLIFKTVVSNSNLARAAREIKELLSDIEGIEIKIIGNKIVADGEVIIPSDLNRVYSVIADSSYRDLVMNLVTVSPIGQKILAKRIQDEINNPKITVRLMNGIYVLEGVVDSRSEASRAESILVNLMPEIVEFNNTPENVKFKRPKRQLYMNLVRVVTKKEAPPQKIVRMTLSFVELAKSYGRNFGFSWQPSLDNGGSIQFGQSSTGGVTSTSNGAFSGTISNLLPRLASAQAAGYVRVLQETTMITQSGIQAEAKRGQKLPVLTLDRNGNQSFQGVDTGLHLKVTPNIAQGDMVSLKLEFSFNSVVGRVTGGAPTLAQNTYKATISLKNNESAAVVNLITNDLLTDFNKDSPGAQSPTNPLFALIRSKAFTKNKSQFVIFVTPQILDSAATGTEDIKKRYGVKR